MKNMNLCEQFIVWLNEVSSLSTKGKKVLFEYVAARHGVKLKAELEFMIDQKVCNKLDRESNQPAALTSSMYLNDTSYRRFKGYLSSLRCLYQKNALWACL